MKSNSIQAVLYRVNVAPHAGAWIEILILLLLTVARLSPPTRGRGLK